MNNRRTTLLGFFIALFLVTATSALPTDIGLSQRSGVNLGCTEGCTGMKAREGGGDIAGTVGYGLNASIALSVNTGMAFMTVLLWSLLALL